MAVLVEKVQDGGDRLGGRSTQLHLMPLCGGAGEGFIMKLEGVASAFRAEEARRCEGGGEHKQTGRSRH